MFLPAVLVTTMLEGDSNNPIENAIDTAAQITDNVMTSVAEVVKGVVSGDNSNLETQPIDVDAMVLGVKPLIVPVSMKMH